jgi:peptidoglycan/LPS O-acetylase OafA/YrhL
LYNFTTNLGRIGVDLFFVLSGFLVSGLLFKEYQKYGDVRPARFLIRRGFKIYPLFWLAIFVFWLINYYNNIPISYPRLIAEFFFLQNYVSGWGYAINHVSWSLAIEEHFYIGLAIILPILFRKKLISRENDINNFRVERTIILIMVCCLSLRIISNILFPYLHGRNYTMTHLRIDSLLAGVLVSYWYYFKEEYLIYFYEKHKKLLIPVALLLLSFSPFIPHRNSFFAMTFGFTFLWAGFSLILIYFIQNKNIETILDKLFSKRIVFVVSKIGYYSYSIYLVHTFINDYFEKYFIEQKFLNFIVCNSVSILIGMIISKYIEYYFLSLRDKWYPARK